MSVDDKKQPNGGQRLSCVALLRERAKSYDKRAKGYGKLADLLDNIIETGSIEDETLWDLLIRADR